MSAWNIWEWSAVECGWALLLLGLGGLWFLLEIRLNRRFQMAIDESAAVEIKCMEGRRNAVSQKDEQKHPEVSVVVCIRNGEAHWSGLWQALKEQSFSRAWEVVVVDDGSSDATPEMLQQSLKESVPFVLRTFRLEGSRPGKKDALSMGLSKAEGDYLLLTDVDGVPASAFWVELMTHALRAQQKDVVLGLSWPMLDSFEQTGWLKMTQALDAMRIARLYIGWAMGGQAYMGVGRNLAIRKSVHPGFESHAHVASGDDDLMIQELMRRGDVRIGTMVSRNAHVDSSLPDSWRGWAKQKKRHWSTARHYSFKHQWNLVKPSILMAGMGCLILVGLGRLNGDGVLHISLWIVASLVGFIWMTGVLTFRLIAKACQAPTKWQRAGWFQPLLFVWTLKTAIWTRLEKPTESSW